MSHLVDMLTKVNDTIAYAASYTQVLTRFFVSTIIILYIGSEYFVARGNVHNSLIPYKCRCPLNHL